MEKLKEAVYYHQAVMIKEILENEDIEVELRPTEMAYMDNVYFGAGGMVDIYVDKNNFEKAKSIIEDYKRSENDNGEG
ncbi:MAG: putative signal transducing protein [Petrotogales bacterium]